MKLIDKDVVVAEIDDWRDKIKKAIFIIPLEGRQRADAAFEYEILGKVRDFFDTLEVIKVGVDFGDPKWDKSAKCIIDTKTLEVKDVDLEKHLKEDIEDVFLDLDGVVVKGATHYITVEDVKYIAKNFFELGLKSKSSYVGIPNIDDTLKEMGVDPDSKEANTFKESFYNALEKFKAQKGEDV
jgi:hypothetical protein